MNRIRHRHVSDACARYNDRLKLNYPAKGYLQWADIKGDGIYRPRLYVVINETGGVTRSHLQGRTMRETIANIDCAALVESE